MEVGPVVRLLQALDDIGEALVLLVQGGHHVREEAGGEIAVVQKVRIVVFLGQRREGAVLLAHVLVRADHVHHLMGVVVVGVHQHIALGVAQGDALQVGVAIDLAVVLPLGQDHHHRHVVNAGAEVPGVAVIVPGVAGVQIAVAHADIVRIHLVGGHVVYHQLLHDLRVDHGVVIRVSGDEILPLGEGAQGAEQRQAQGHGQDLGEQSCLFHVVPSKLQMVPVFTNECRPRGGPGCFHHRRGHRGSNIPRPRIPPSHRPGARQARL